MSTQTMTPDNLPAPDADAMEFSEGDAQTMRAQIDFYIRETDKLLEKIYADQQQVDKDAAETRAILRRSDDIIKSWQSK